MRVLVTRPEPGASATAQRLAALGHEPVLLPLTRTRALDPGQVPDGAAFDAVIATSAAAIRHARRELIDAIAALPLHAVGDRTARAAAEAGFRRIVVTAANVDALAAELPRRLAPGGRILHLAGRVRTGDLTAKLIEAGFDAAVIEVYDTVADENAFEQAGERLGPAPIDTVLVYSAYAAAMVSRLLARPELEPSFVQARFLCISARVGDALGAAFSGRVEVAESPDEAALLHLL